LKKVEDVLSTLVQLRKKLQDSANPNCKKCYGRGYIGVYAQSIQHYICKCVFKKIKEERFKFKETK